MKGQDKKDIINSYEKLDKWEKVQYDSFKNWVNINLSSINSNIEKLEDFHNGVQLAKLVEILIKKSLGGINANPKFQMHKMSNITLALEALKKEGLRLENIGSTDIHDSNLKLIMGLIWILILQYQINKIDLKGLDNLEGDSNSSSNEKDQKPTKSNLTAKDKLLLYCQNLTKGYPVEVKNLTTDMSDGSVLACMIYSKKPNAINPRKIINGKEKLANIKEVLNVLEKEFQVPHVINPENITEEPEEKAMMTFISYVIEGLEKHPTVKYNLDDLGSSDDSSSSSSSDTIPSRIFSLANGIKGPTNAYFTKQENSWKPVTWKEYSQQIEGVARSFVSHGVKKGERVAIIGRSSPSWSTFYLGAQMIGAVPVGIYETFSVSNIKYVLENTQVRIVLVESEAELKLVQQIRSTVTTIKYIVLYKRFGESGSNGNEILSWSQFLSKGESTKSDEVQDLLSKLSENDESTHFYTPGATGKPKSVVLTHRNLSLISKEAQKSFEIRADDTYLCSLSLAHTNEQLFSIWIPSVSGSKVYYSESSNKVIDNLKEVQPTIFYSSPKIWERIYFLFSSKVSSSQVEKLPKESKSKYLSLVGLSNMRVSILGVLSIDTLIIRYFLAFGINIIEFYGQSETTGITTLNKSVVSKVGSAGKQLTGVEIKIGDDSEVLVKGSCVFSGYFNDPQLTQKRLKNGYYYTDDIGYLEDGNLYIRGRRSDLISLSGDIKVYPLKIENALRSHQFIDKTCLVGNNRKFLAALISPDMEAIERHCKSKNLDTKEFLNSDLFKKEIKEHVELVNNTLENKEKIGRYNILKVPFTIEGGELNPVDNIVRDLINQKYGGEIEMMYSSVSPNFDCAVGKLVNLALSDNAKDAYYVKRGNKWEPVTWGKYFDNVQLASRSLVSNGVNPQQKVLIISRNSPASSTIYLACQFVGAVAVPLFTDLKLKELELVFKDTNAPLAFVQDKDQFSLIEKNRNKFPSLKKVFLLNEDNGNGKDLLPWNEFIISGESTDPSTIESRVLNTKPETPAVLIYKRLGTSSPKGIVLSHAALQNNSGRVAPLVGLNENSKYLSSRPLAHLDELLFAVHLPVILGYKVYFAESPQKELENMREVQPNIVVSPVKKWNKISKKIQKKIPFEKAKSSNKNDKEKEKEPFGLKECSLAISFDGPLCKNDEQYFDDLELPILPLFEELEACGPITFSSKQNKKNGTSGRPIEGNKVEISNEKDKRGNGEIIVASPSLFSAVFNDPKGYDSKVNNGKLKTGYLGEIDKDGYLKVKGLKEDQFTLDDGTPVNPRELERELNEHPFIEDAFVLGQGRVHPVALFSPNLEEIKESAKENKMDLKDFLKSPKFKDVINNHIDNVNKSLPEKEKIQKYKVLDEPFHLNEEILPEEELNREVIAKNFENDILKLDPLEELKLSLLDWLDDEVGNYKGVKIEKAKPVKENLQNALPLCALVNKYRPNLLNYDNLNQNSHGDNAEKAFDLLDKEFDVPQTISPKNLASGNLEEPEAIKYLSLCKDKLKDIKEQDNAIKNNPKLQNLKKGLDTTRNDYEKTKADPLPLQIERNKIPTRTLESKNVEKAPKKVKSKKTNYVEPNIALKKFALLSDYKLALASERHIKNIEKLDLLISEGSKDGKQIESLKNAIDDGKKLLVVNINHNHKKKVEELNPGKKIDHKYLELPENQLKQFDDSLKTSGSKVNPNNINELKENDINILDDFLEKQKVPKDIKTSALAHSIIEELDHLLDDLSDEKNKSEVNKKPKDTSSTSASLNEDLPLLYHVNTPQTTKVVEKETDRLLNKLKKLNEPTKGKKPVSNEKKDDNKKPFSTTKKGIKDEDIKEAIQNPLSVSPNDKVIKLICDDVENEFENFKNVMNNPKSTEAEKTNAAVNYKAVLKGALSATISPLRQVQISAQAEMKILDEIPLDNLDTNQDLEQKYIDKISNAANKLDKNIICALDDEQIPSFQRRNLKKLSPVLKSALIDHLKNINDLRDVKDPNKKKDAKEKVEKSADKLEKVLKCVYDLCSLDTPLDKLSDSIKKAKIAIDNVDKVANCGDFYPIESDLPQSIQELDSKMVPVLFNLKLLSLQQPETYEKIKHLTQKLKKEMKEAKDGANKLNDHAKKEVEKNENKGNNKLDVLPLSDSNNDIHLIKKVDDPLEKIKLALDLIPEITKCDLVDQLNKAQLLLEAIPPSVSSNDVPYTLENSSEVSKHAKNFAVSAGKLVSLKNDEKEAEKLSKLIDQLEKKLDEKNDNTNKVVEEKFKNPKSVDDLLKNCEEINQKLNEIRDIVLPFPSEKELLQSKNKKPTKEKIAPKNVDLLNDIEDLEQKFLPLQLVEDVDDALLKFDEIIVDFDEDKKDKVKDDLADMMKELDFGLKGTEDSLFDPSHHSLLSLLVKESKTLSSFVDSSLDPKAMDNYQKIVDSADQMKNLHSLILKGLNLEVSKARNNKTDLGESFVRTVPLLTPLYDSTLVDILKSVITFITSPENSPKKNLNRLQFLSECTRLRQLIIFFISLLYPKPHLIVLASSKDSIQSLELLNQSVKNNDYSSQDINLNKIRENSNNLGDFGSICASISPNEDKKKKALENISAHNNNVNKLSDFCLIPSQSSKENILLESSFCKESAEQIPESVDAPLYGNVHKADLLLASSQILLKSDSPKQNDLQDLLSEASKLVDNALNHATKHSPSNKQKIIQSIKKESPELKDKVLKSLSNESKNTPVEQNVPKFNRAKPLRDIQSLRNLLKELLSDDSSTNDDEKLSAKKLKNRNKLENSASLPLQKILDTISQLKENKTDELNPNVEEIKKLANDFKKDSDNVARDLPEGDLKDYYKNQLKDLDNDIEELVEGVVSFNKKDKEKDNNNENDQENSKEENLAGLLCDLEKLEDKIQNLATPPLSNQDIIDKQLDMHNKVDDIISSIDNKEDPKDIKKKLDDLQKTMSDLSDDSKKYSDINKPKSKKTNKQTVEPLKELRKALAGENVPLKETVLPEFTPLFEEPSIDEIMKKNYYDKKKGDPNIVLPGKESGDKESLYDYIDEEQEKLNDSLPKNPTELNIAQRENLGRLLESAANGDLDGVKKLLKKILENVKKTLDKADKYVDKKKGTPEKRNKVKEMVRKVEQNLNDLSRDAIKSQADPENKVLFKLLKADISNLNQNHAELIDLLSDPVEDLVDQMRKQIDWQNKALKKKNPHAIEAGAEKLNEQSVPLSKNAKKKALNPIYSDKDTQDKISKAIKEIQQIPPENLRVSKDLKNRPNENPRKKLDNIEEKNIDLSNVLDSLENAFNLSPIEIILLAYKNGSESAKKLDDSIINKNGSLPKHVYDVCNYYQNAINATRKIAPEVGKKKKKRLNKLARRLDDSLTKYLANVKHAIYKINKSDDAPKDVLEKIKSKADKNHDLVEKILDELNEKIPKEKADLIDIIRENQLEKEKQRKLNPVGSGKQKQAKSKNTDSPQRGTDQGDKNITATRPKKKDSEFDLGSGDFSFGDSPKSDNKNKVPLLKGLKIGSDVGGLNAPRNANDKIQDLKKKHGKVVDAIRRKESPENVKKANKEFKDAVDDTLDTMHDVANRSDDTNKKEIEKNLKEIEEMVPLQEEYLNKYYENPNDLDVLEVKHLNNDLLDLINELEQLNLDKEKDDEFSDLQNLLGLNDDLKSIENKLMGIEDEDDDDSDLDSSSYEDGDSIDDDLVDAIENTRDLSNLVKDIAQQQDKNDKNLRDIMDIIDELEDFVPKMIEDAPKIKENVVESKNDPNHINDPKKNKALLKNYVAVQDYIPQIEHKLKDKPSSATDKAKKKNNKVNKAVKDGDKDDLKDGLDDLIDLNGEFLKKALNNLEDLDNDDKKKKEGQKLIEELKNLLPEQEKKAKKKLDKIAIVDDKEKKKDKKKKYKKMKQNELDNDDDFSSSDDSSSDSSDDDDIAEKIEEKMDDIGLLFPDLQLNGDIDLLLSNLDDPNFGLEDDGEKNKKERRNRKKNKKNKNDEYEDDDVPLFGKGQGSIRLRPSEWNRPELDMEAFYPEEEMAYDPLSTRQNRNIESDPFESLSMSDFDNFEKLPGSKLDLGTIDVVDVDEQKKKIDNVSDLLITPSQVKEGKKNKNAPNAKIVKATSPENLDSLVKNKAPNLSKKLKQLVEKLKDPLKLDLEAFLRFVLELIKMCKVISASLEDQELAKELDELTEVFANRSKEFILAIKLLKTKDNKKGFEMANNNFLASLGDLILFLDKLNPSKKGSVQIKEIANKPSVLKDKDIEQLILECQVVLKDIGDIVESPLKRNTKNGNQPTDDLDQDRLIALLILLILLHYSIELKLKENSKLRLLVNELREKINKMAPLFIEGILEPSKEWPAQLGDFEKLVDEDKKLIEQLYNALLKPLYDNNNQQTEKDIELVENLLGDLENEEFLTFELQPSPEQSIDSKRKINNQASDLNNLLLDALTGDGRNFDVSSFTNAILVVIKESKVLLLSLKDDKKNFNKLKSLSDDLGRATLLLIKVSRQLTSLPPELISSKEYEVMKNNFFDLINRCMVLLENLTNFLQTLQGLSPIDINTDEDTKKMLKLFEQPVEMKQLENDELPDGKSIIEFDVDALHKQYLQELTPLWKKILLYIEKSKKDPNSLDLNDVQYNITLFFKLLWQILIKMGLSYTGRQFALFIRETWLVLILEWFILLKRIQSNPNDHITQEKIRVMVPQIENNQKNFEKFFHSNDPSSLNSLFAILSKLKKEFSALEKCEQLTAKDPPSASLSLEDFKQQLQQSAEDYKKKFCEGYSKVKVVHIQDFDHTSFVTVFIKFWKLTWSGIMSLSINDGEDVQAKKMLALLIKACMRVIERTICLFVIGKNEPVHGKLQQSFCETMKAIFTVFTKLQLLVKTSSGDEDQGFVSEGKRSKDFLTDYKNISTPLNKPQNGPPGTGFQNLSFQSVEDKLNEQLNLLNNLQDYIPNNNKKDLSSEDSDKINDAANEIVKLHMNFSLLNGRGFDAQKFLELIEKFSKVVHQALYFVIDDLFRKKIIVRLTLIMNTTHKLISLYNKNGCKETDETSSIKVDISDAMLFIINALQEYCEKNTQKCDSCRKPITGQYVAVGDQNFHAECFICVSCNTRPTFFYNKDGNVFCQPCYNKKYLDQCKRCSEPILPGDEFLQVKDSKFHSACFTCHVCNSELPPRGFGFNNGEVYCEKHDN